MKSSRICRGYCVSKHVPVLTRAVLTLLLLCMFCFCNQMVLSSHKASVEETVVCGSIRIWNLVYKQSWKMSRDEWLELIRSFNQIIKSKAWEEMRKICKVSQILHIAVPSECSGVWFQILVYKPKHEGEAGSSSVGLYLIMPPCYCSWKKCCNSKYDVLQLCKFLNPFFHSFM